MINTTIIGRFRVIKKLGEGGMGEVYLAEDLELDRKVALKFLPQQFTANADFKARFKREAKATAALSHSNVVTIYEVGEHQDRSFIAMEYVDGQSLFDLLNHKPLRVHEAIDIALQICAGMGKAHRLGIVHRDLKPANILIDKEGQVKIVDFGLAKLEGVTQLTKAGTMMGTPHYMSPEQVHGDKLDQRSDIFSVGVVLYELLTGRLPFPGEEQMAVLYSIVHEAPKPLADHISNLTAGLQTIIDKTLEKDRKKRYQRIAELATDLEKERPLALATEQQTLTFFSPRIQPATKPLSRTSIFIRQHGRSVFFAIGAVAVLIPAAFLLSALFKGKSAAALSIDSTPPGATVLVNGDSIGVTRLEYPTTAFGELALRVQKQDYLPIDTSVVISQGRDSSFSFVLQPAANMSITVDPPDAEVALNGKLIDPSRFADLQLRAGEYDMNVSRQGYQMQRGKLFLKQGANPPLKFVLKKASESADAPEFGGVTISSTPTGATVMIAGKPRGKTPFVDDKLKPGTYDVSVTLEGYEDFSTNMTITLGKREPLMATLSAQGELNIASEPGGASVLIDGNQVGTTPYTDQQMKAGEHRVVLLKKGYEDYATTVMVNPRQVNKLEAELKVLMGKLSVLVKPFGSIFVDGGLMKKDSNVQYAIALAAGEHQLRVVHPTFGEWTKTIEIGPERRADFTIDFNRIVSLTITAFDESGKPLVGQIYVDNQSTREVTPKQLRLRVGQHVFEVRRGGYLAAIQRINLENNVEEPLRFILKKE